MEKDYDYYYQNVEDVSLETTTSLHNDIMNEYSQLSLASDAQQHQKRYSGICKDDEQQYGSEYESDN